MSYTPKRCSFCSRPIPLGQGIMFVRNDAATFWYCSSKCRKNASVLRRDPRKLKWARRGRTAVARHVEAVPETRKLAEATVPGKRK